MNLEDSNNELNSFDRDLRKKLSDWDSGETPDIWEGLSESLSVESVWDRLDNDLVADIPSVDQQLQQSYGEWSPVPDGKVWDKVDHSLSIESVWHNLSSSLSEPARPSNPWLKIAVACVVALIVGNRVSDGNIRLQPENQFFVSDLVVGQPVGEVINADELTSAENTVVNKANANNSTGNNPIPTNRRNSSQEPILVTFSNPGNNEHQIVVPENGFHDELISAQKDIDTSENSPEEVVQAEEIASLSMHPGNYSNAEGLVAMPLWEPRKIISDRWTLQLGTQLSVMKETGREQLTSALPRLGLAADIAYKKRFGNLQLIGAFGLSQYTQASGKYTNGRYYSSEQKINSLQLTGSLGYSFGRTTFYGGVVISNMFQALEENGNKITQVYRFREIEPGMTAGMDYRIWDWSRRNRPVSIGLQYQYLPGNSTGGSTFEKMHGIRLQAKFGF